MFDFRDDGGLGFQLSMYRLIDDLSEARQIGRENALTDQVDRLRAGYNRLLTYAQGVERDLEERNRQLSAVQNDLALRTQQLEAAQNELKTVYARNAFEASQRHMTMIAVQDRLRERDRQRLAGSQPE